MTPRAGHVTASALPRMYGTPRRAPDEENRAASVLEQGPSPLNAGALLMLPVIDLRDEVDADESFVSVAEHALGRSASKSSVQWPMGVSVERRMEVSAAMRPMEASITSDDALRADDSGESARRRSAYAPWTAASTLSTPHSPVSHVPPLAKNGCELRRQRIVQRNLRPAALADIRGWLDGSDQGVSGQLGALLDPADAAGHAARTALRDTPGGRVPTFADTVRDAMRFVQRRASFVQSASVPDRAQDDALHAALASNPRSTRGSVPSPEAARSASNLAWRAAVATAVAAAAATPEASNSAWRAAAASAVAAAAASPTAQATSCDAPPTIVVGGVSYASTPRSTLGNLNITQASRSRFAPAAQQRLSIAMSVDISHQAISPGSPSLLEGLTSASFGRTTSGGRLNAISRSTSDRRLSDIRRLSANPLLPGASREPTPCSLVLLPPGVPSPTQGESFQ
jgi:hypothetical protein